MDRRSHPRSSLHLPVYLVKTGCSDVIQTETENVSKDGFFVFIDSPISPGETLRFLLLLPDVSEIAPAASRVCVHGELQIVRSCPDPSRGRFGVGCQFTSYRVLPDSGTLAAGDLVRKVLSLDARTECMRAN